ncbi:hypothetical protein RhiirC2_727882 [Rhizophagus irregularis]|uniref:Uncharacterized protein n=1 Tax=Rhizophagus irregularis TaxID=588596 RepID=A0A2N1NZ28_9GLOM|nr:hypothetical protein RhiirC2_727882 [Rhizophagus irregularis]
MSKKNINFCPEENIYYFSETQLLLAHFFVSFFNVKLSRISRNNIPKNYIKRMK